jgi:transcriptional regulator with XRE-family HTH domain
MTGLDLKLKRTAAQVKARDLARLMGITPSRISAIERTDSVTPEMEERYLGALGTLTNVPHIEVAV